MDNEQKKYILENARKMPADKIARALGLRERNVRKFLELEERKKKPVTAPVEMPGSLSPKQFILVALSLLGLGFLIYSNTFHASFHGDDEWSIVKNPAMLKAFDLNFLWKTYGLRFFTYFTFALNHHFGQLDVFGYHLVNISIHIVTSILVFFFLYLTAQTPHMRRDPLPLPAFWVAFGGALLFLSHPIQTQAVTYIVQRSALLATLLYVSVMVCYVQWRLSKNSLFYGLAILSGCLAILSKEISATFPVALLLFEFCFFDREERKTSRIVLWIIPFFLLLLLFIPLLNYYKVFETANLPTESQALSRGQYFLTQSRVIATYIRLLFLPVHQTLDYYFPLSRTLADPATFLSFLFLTGIFLAGLALFKQSRFISFGIFWFFITLSVESSVIPILDVINEHRLYLPMVGFCFILCGVLLWWVKDLKKWMIILLTITVILGCLTYLRNRVWKNDFTLWEDVIKKAPKKNRGYNQLGAAYRNEKQYQKAIEYHLRSLELWPDNDLALNSLGSTYAAAKQLDKAAEAFRKAIKINPTGVSDYYNNLGTVLSDLGRSDEAIQNYLQAIKLSPGTTAIYRNLGLEYLTRGEIDKAEEQIVPLKKLHQYDWAKELENESARLRKSR